MKVLVKGVGVNSDEVGYAQLPLQLPHKVLEYLISDCGLHIRDELLQSYWDHLDEVNDEIAVNTRQFRAACQEQQVWPLGLHGDEACMALENAPHDMIYGIWLNVPVFRPKSTRLARFLLFSLESNKVVSAELTFFPVLEQIVASLNLATESGVAGRRFVTTELRGDQAWFRFLLRHRSWWIANNVCFRCKACAKGDASLNYTVYEGENDWLTTVRSTNDFVGDELPLPLCSQTALHPNRFNPCKQPSL